MHRMDAAVESFHLLNHPFYQRWQNGTLKRSELQRYAVQYYPHVEAFPTYVSGVHAQSNDLPMRQMLLENLIEEERGEENHPELWLRFGEGIGVSRDDIHTGEKLPAAQSLVETFRTLTAKSVASGLGALYAYESQVPAVATQKIKGLKEHYGLTDERGLKFFDVHLKADELHSTSEREAIENLSPEEQVEAETAAKTASRALWDFLTALDEVEAEDTLTAKS